MTAPLKRGRLATAALARVFALGGDATLTLVSGKTQARYTYRVRRHEDEAVHLHFVSVLFGSNNEGDFAYIGVIADGGDYRRTPKSRVTATDPRHAAFAYFWQHVSAGSLPPQLEVWHEGRCCRCRHKLTVPRSIELGIGPECEKRFAPALAALRAEQQEEAA